MENIKDPFDYQEALNLLHTAVDPNELDINVIARTIGLDDKNTQELKDFVNNLPNPDYGLPGLNTQYFLSHKLIKPQMYPNDDPPNTFVEFEVQVQTSATTTMTTKVKRHTLDYNNPNDIGRLLNRLIGR